MARINNEPRGKLEKAMEQLIAAQTAKEHAREKVGQASAHTQTHTHTRTRAHTMPGCLATLVTVSSLSWRSRCNADRPHNRSCQTGCCGGPTVRVSVVVWSDTAAAVTVCCHLLLPSLAAVACCSRCLLSQAHEESSKAVQYYSECQQMGTERAQLLTERQQMLAAAEKRASDWQALKAKYIQKSSTLKEVGWAGGFVSGVRVCRRGAV